MTEGVTPEQSSEDPFVVAVRQYILDTLTPLIPGGDSQGKFMYSLLRRALRTAQKEDLEQVVLHCVAFTDGLRANGFITEELARQAADYLNPGAFHDAISTTADDSTSDWSPVPGQGAADWTDTERQEHAGEAPPPPLPVGHESGDAQGLEPSTDSGSGHQAAVEGDADSIGTEHAEVVQEDGAG